jgi:hypothetical protein
MCFTLGSYSVNVIYSGQELFSYFTHEQWTRQKMLFMAKSLEASMMKKKINYWFRFLLKLFCH